MTRSSTPIRNEKIHNNNKNIPSKCIIYTFYRFAIEFSQLFAVCRLLSLYLHFFSLMARIKSIRIKYNFQIDSSCHLCLVNMHVSFNESGNLFFIFMKTISCDLKFELSFLQIGQQMCQQICVVADCDENILRKLRLEN